MKILHVTESLAAGVGHYLVLVANAQTKMGHEVIIAHSVRPDTPVEHLDQMYDSAIRRVVIPMVTKPSPVADTKAIIGLMGLLQTVRPDVVHLHSSKAGVLGRLASKVAFAKTKVFYSPHGFAFLRQDVSRLKQRIFLMFEQVGSWLGGTLVACSATEADLAKKIVGCRSVVLVENATNLTEIPAWQGRRDEVVRVLNSGRISYQKNPSCFQQVAAGCRDLPVSFTWMGEGGLASTLISDGSIEVAGWQPREVLMERLAQADIFLMPSLWEGMPLALIEAQAVGLPAVVSDVVGCRDAVIDGETGFVCKTTDELIAKTRLLIENPGLRRKLGNNAASCAKSRFDVMRLNRELIELYQSPL